ncbi:hypothetical protein [Streptomyces sp. 8L]|uniref:hypothetical protein n=1 Tax=Streptomyces sp. 8L TaxID=2877242 RepID=UPI001CD571C5|nr:hypothetical protein [Streptomyces sp. 8L]MCA1223100.1 hypothetical protein [Streptomyces sp. 8L]
MPAEPDVAAVARIVRGSTYPEVAQWADCFLHACATDAETLRTFAGAGAGAGAGASVPETVPRGATAGR